MFESRLLAATTGNSESQNTDSNLNIQIKVGAVLHIFRGVLGLMAAIAILGAVVGVAGRIVLWQGEHGAATAIVIVAMLIGVFLAMLALLGIIGGWG